MIGEAKQTEALPVQVQRAQPMLRPVSIDSVENRRMSNAERRLLRVLADPHHYDASNAERAKAAGISESRLYDLLRDPWFRDQEKQLMRGMVQTELAPIVRASIDTAKKPGRDGFNDRRVWLETVELYQPRQQIDHTTAGQPLVGVVGVDPSAL